MTGGKLQLIGDPTAFPKAVGKACQTVNLARIFSVRIDTSRPGAAVTDHNDIETSPSLPDALVKRDPIVRAVTVPEIVDSLAKGLRDFQSAPIYGLVFGALYAAGGNIVVLCAFALGVGYLAYPLAAGFALIGPFIAVGLYEVSRRRESGEPLSWDVVFSTIWAQGRRELGWMAFVTLFIFIIWMYQVRLLIALMLGLKSFSSLQEFLTVVTTTPEGWTFLIIGHVTGAVLSLVLYTLTVVSFPLLLDRDVDFVTAMITSVRAVVASPGPMIGWAAAVVILMIVACLPAFLGLLVVLPVLGHATWHLYRRIVVPEPDPAQI